MSMVRNVVNERNYALVRQLVITDFKLRYQASVLGYLWSLARPMMLFGVLYVVFTFVFRIGDSIPNYPTYLLLGLVLWTYFVEATNNSLTAIVGRGDLLRKVKLPRYTIILSSSFSALVNLLFNLVVVFVFMALTGVPVSWTVLLLPLHVLLLFVWATSLGFGLSALYVKYRDISHIWDVVLQTLFYATPLIYPLSLLERSPALQNLLLLNPLAFIIQEARYAVITPETVRAQNVFPEQWMVVLPLLIMGVVAVVAVRYFRRQAPYFAENL